MSSSGRAFALAVGCSLWVGACGGSAPPTSPPAPEPAPGPTPPPPTMTRLRFNQLALRLDLPLFWEADRDGDGAPDPDEVRTLLFYPAQTAWVAGGTFTPAFDEAKAAIDAAHASAPPADERLRLVLEELDHAAPTLVYTDLAKLPEAHRTFAVHMLQVAHLIDRAYAKQTGTERVARETPPADVASRSLFRRNWGIACRGATTEANKACSALAKPTKQNVDVYPLSVQAKDGFCADLEKRPDAKKLLSPFAVVREADGGNLVTAPYPEAYAEEMKGIATELRAAAKALETDPDEKALVKYLTAAAKSFDDNKWEPADEAWSVMTAKNSRWYVRVAPDEVYWDPCSQKAGFHLSFALINRDSLAWQDKLTPIQNDMEKAVAALAADVYKPRKVSFHMPDFIDIVLNAGDSRNPFGATIGQSLPNWGPVSEEGRGRTVAMTNLYTDPDSLARRREVSETLLSKETMASYTQADLPGLVSTILHEATHNLGPANEYRVNGKKSADIFGGGMASMLEELKAQSGALFYLPMIRERGLVDEKLERESYVDSVTWAFGHISRGMYTPEGQRKAYSQLSAIQVGFLLEKGALVWDADAPAANGKDKGAFTIDFAKFPGAAKELMTQVVRILASGDRPGAEEMAKKYVDGTIVPQAIIAERYQRFPQAAFVYALDGAGAAKE